MSINFEKAFGIHQYTMPARAKRAEVLATNIANADTPGFKAQDIDFSGYLQKAMANQQGMSLSRTNEKHVAVTVKNREDLKFRNPNQPDTGDGNSVDTQVERNLYVQNSIEYQASVNFLSGKIAGLKKALTGGGQ